MANQHTTPAHGIPQLSSYGNYNPAEIRLLWETRGRIKVTEAGCWEWQGSRTRLGYGRVYLGNDKDQYAHRFVYERCIGQVPDGKVVCHHCDNPPCCNPAHLFMGVQADNLKDMKAKGRARGGMRRGEDASVAKLTEAKVREIRSRAATAKRGECGKIAADFGIDFSTYRRIVNRKTWGHVR